MGEYADDYFRKEIMGTYGFDPGSMYEKSVLKKHKCSKCGKKFEQERSMTQHFNDKHKAKVKATGEQQ
jgi:hypothetical protein